jgi:glycosyltransferase involved in cell wall biosynthesis
VTAEDDLTRRLTALEERFSRLQAVVQRAYEDPLGAAAEVLRARRDPGYEEAYAEAPLVSARIGAYRGGDALFERAIASVRAQSYENWEAIVVCDGPDEETAERIAALGDERLRCYQRPRNGPYPEDREQRWRVAGCHPFNQGVALARGAWIAPLDQDDEWSADHLEVLLGAARATRAEVVYGIAEVDLGAEGETWFGSWPPRQGEFGFQAAIYHAGLAALVYDVNSHLVGEPADWNLARRMLEAGVSFEFTEHPVTRYFASPADGASWGYWKERQRAVDAFGEGD